MRHFDVVFAAFLIPSSWRTDDSEVVEESVLELVGGASFSVVMREGWGRRWGA